MPSAHESSLPSQSSVGSTVVHVVQYFRPTLPLRRWCDTTDNAIMRPQSYPAVKPDPSIDDCLRAIRTSDYMQWTAFTLGSWAYGFTTGKPARFGMAGLMAGIGFTFGSLVMVQNTRGRLMGFRENEREVAKYGVAEGSPSGPDLFRPKPALKEQ